MTKIAFEDHCITETIAPHATVNRPAEREEGLVEQCVVTAHCCDNPPCKIYTRLNRRNSNSLMINDAMVGQNLASGVHIGHYIDNRTSQ